MAEMNNVEMARALSDLVQLDIDAAHAYDQAIASIDIVSLRDQLIAFKEDHLQHITQLSKVVRALDVVPPEYSQDFKGYLIEGFTALRSVTGTEGALSAMKTNEELTNRRYRKACALPLTPNIKALVEHNYRDEQMHLAFIEKALVNRV